MATYFGEVVFPSSRAFWDGYEEEESINELQEESHINVTWIKDKPTSIKKLIVIEGEIIIDYFKKFLKEESEKICVIQNENNKELGAIHHVSVDLCIFNISPSFDLKNAGEFVIKISDILSICECTYLIHWRHISHYKSAVIPHEHCFIRCLYKNNENNLCKSNRQMLEQPNIIHGVAAGILSYAQMMDYHSILYVLYSDNFVFDSEAAKQLMEIYEEINKENLDKLPQVEKNSFYKGNLYM
ncbi:PREDICTED: proteasome assembly chaperone 1 [Polistes dominula]|uniref:Proteasome assembly chaperone 1 n=1 Tax=Polistes dominula TaxID=743375 RepID=A0ABM1IHY0_POLDO|nr:PREDICTED: proteasome assembly chaperone 1 [Polistes dominula]